MHTKATPLTPAEFMRSRDMSNPDIKAYHIIVETILNRLTQLCSDNTDSGDLRNGVIDILITFDTQPTEH